MIQTTKNFLLLFFIFSCSEKKINQEQITEPTTKNRVELTEAQHKNTDIETILLTDKAIATILKLYGKIEIPPQNAFSVAPPMSGYLRATQLLPGMFIKKGDFMATLEDLQYIQLQQEYLLSKSKLSLAEIDYARQKDLNKSQASSDKITQQAEYELNIHKINTQALAEKLQLIHIIPEKITANTLTKSISLYSPMTGYISKMNAVIGKHVAPSDVLFEIINTSDLHLTLKIFEKDISKLYIGQTVWAYDNNRSDVKYLCKVILISPEITSEGTVEVHCHFEKQDKMLVPGMYMNAEIELKSNTNQALPEESVVRFEGKEFVFIQIKDRVYEIIEVQTGEKNQNFIAIKNAQSLKNKMIVTKGAYTLLMKLKNRGDEE